MTVKKEPEKLVLLPTGMQYMNLVNRIITTNIRQQQEIRITLPSRVETAYMLVNKTGILPVALLDGRIVYNEDL